MKPNLPAFGIGAPQQPQFDVTEAIPKKCQSCDCEFFNAVYRMGTIPSMAIRNRTGQDVPIKFEAYLCWECGAEYGKEGK